LKQIYYNYLNFLNILNIKNRERKCLKNVSDFKEFETFLGKAVVSHFPPQRTAADTQDASGHFSPTPGL